MKTGRLSVLSAVFAAGSVVLAVRMLETGDSSEASSPIARPAAPAQGVRPIPPGVADRQRSQVTLSGDRRAAIGAQNLSGNTGSSLPAADREGLPEVAGGLPVSASRNASIAIRIAATASRMAIRLPVVLQEAPGIAAGLTRRQAAMVESIRDQFIADIGGEPADPACPEYAKRWRHARPVADQRLRAMLGAQAFAQWQAGVYLGGGIREAALHGQEPAD